MLNKAKTLEGYTLDSLDGNIGKVKDFYFDDLVCGLSDIWLLIPGNWLSFNPSIDPTLRSNCG